MKISNSFPSFNLDMENKNNDFCLLNVEILLFVFEKN